MSDLEQMALMNRIILNESVKRIHNLKLVLSGVGMQRLTGFTINRALKRHG